VQARGQADTGCGPPCGGPPPSSDFLRAAVTSGTVTGGQADGPLDLSPVCGRAVAQWRAGGHSGG
jgi:hypothetical protein